VVERHIKNEGGHAFKKSSLVISRRAAGTHYVKKPLFNINTSNLTMFKPKLTQAKFQMFGKTVKVEDFSDEEE
jgi:hypothetical protein